MTHLTRRNFLGWTAAGAALAGSAPARGQAGRDPKGLRPLTADAEPISPEEHAMRIAKLKSLITRQGAAGLLVEAGPSLEYFTGVRWWRSERATAALIPASGEVIVVTPFFEVPSVQETLKIVADVRPFHEDESPFELLAKAMREIPASAGPVLVEDTTRFFILDRVVKANAGHGFASGAEVVNFCRAVKSPAERELMQAANDVTIHAIRNVHGRIETGMTAADIKEMLVGATEALGGTDTFSLVLLNEASAYPHGTVKPQTVREGSVILIDTGCTVHGYASDISRTWIHGEPAKRHREVWDTVKRGQEIVLETAKIGAPVGDMDIAVRNHYESLGWAKNYGLPGTSHRAGHGIGMEGHEPPNLMRADRTPLEAGMCFSNEPGIYIPGEFGVRMEDCWYMTAQGPELFTPLAKSIDEPI
jgi:Xaa-Pro dipeptidase